MPDEEPLLIAASQPAASGVGDWLERITKVSAVSVALIYAVGFLVVNTYYSKFGMADFSLLKPKIMAAGVIFVFLALLPIVLAARTYGLFGLRSNTLPMTVKPEAVWANNCSVILTLYIGAFNLALVSGFLFSNSLFSNRLADRLLIVIGLWLAVILLERISHFRYPRSFLALEAALVITLAVMLGKSDIYALWLTIWFYVWELLTVWVSKKAKNGAFWRSIRWEAYAGMPIILVTLFSQGIYGRVLTRYGGGFPSKVIVYLSPETHKAGFSSPMTAWLIDEGDHGYYVLRSEDAKRALYLPREMIRALEFVASDMPEQEKKAK